MSSQLNSNDELSGSTIWRRFWPAILVVGFGVAFSLSVFYLLRSWENKDAAKAFTLAAEDRAMAVKGAFDTELAMLDLVRSALVTDGRIERQEFREILEPFLSRSRSIQAVEWVPRVPDSRRKEYEEAAVKDGLKNFQFREEGSDGKFKTAARRGEYFPIYFIGPQQDNKNIYGYDLGSEPTRLEAVKIARDTGKTAASGKIAFVNETKSEGGFFVALPVYERGKSTKTLSDRRANFSGVVLGVFRPNDMIQAALGKLQAEGIDVGMYDASVGEKSLFYRASRSRDATSDPMEPKRLLDENTERYAVTLDSAGHPWTVVCMPTPEFKAAHHSGWPGISLAFGMAFTVMAAGYLFLKIGHAERLEAKVQEQTSHIRAAQEDVLYRLASASQWRGDETTMHIRRIGQMSHALARAVDWYGDDLDAIRQAAPMHDIGKIGIPDAVLMKTEKLTLQEAEVLKNHTRIGAEILAGSDVPMLKMAKEIAACHHERWDGAGYPKGIAKKDIPESARIVAIVDTYDTLTHVGLNRTAMSEDDALAIMQAESEKQFDPVLLSAFFKNIAEMRSISDRCPEGNRNNVRKAPFDASLPPSVLQSGALPEFVVPQT